MLPLQVGSNSMVESSDSRGSCGFESRLPSTTNQQQHGNDNQQLRHGHHQRPTKAEDMEAFNETRQPVHHLQQLPREEASG